MTFLFDNTQPTPSRSHRRLRWAALILGLLTTAILGSGLILVLVRIASPSRPVNRVSLLINQQSQRYTTSVETVGEFLSEQHLTLTPGDSLYPPLSATLASDTTISLTRARPVRITYDMQEHEVWTTLVNPSDILKQAGLPLGAHDRLELDGHPVSTSEFMLWTASVRRITIQPSVTLTILDGTKETTLTTSVDTIGEALYEAGITLYSADIVTPDLGESLTDAARIVITRAQPVTIQANGQTIETLYSGQTVGDALAEAGLTLVGLDYSIPSEDSPVAPGMIIQVVHVTEDLITEDESLPYETLYQADASRELDTRAVIQAGQAGIQRHTVRVRYENNVEISREYLGSEEITPIQNEIIAYGTQIVLRTIDTPEGPREYWRTFKVYATSYKPAALGGDSSTALGMKLQKGMIGADPKLIPWRTNLYVPEYGLGIMGDTGGARRSRYWIDLGYSDEDYVSWHRYTEIYLLTPVPEEIPYLLPTWGPP